MFLDRLLKFNFSVIPEYRVGIVTVLAFSSLGVKYWDAEMHVVSLYYSAVLIYSDFFSMKRIDSHLLKARLGTSTLGKLVIIRVISVYHLNKSVASKVLDSLSRLDKAFYKEVSEDGNTIIWER